MIEQLMIKTIQGSEANPLKETLLEDLSESVVQDSILTIENSSLESLTLDNQETLVQNAVNEKENIEETSPFSDAINTVIKTIAELKVYLDAGLKEVIVNDRLVLIDTTIDPDLKDDMGRTNLERMEQGLAPLDENGESYNLHHIGQDSDAPLAELKNGTHKENDGVLHDSSVKESKIDRAEFAKERAEHWKARAEEIKAEIAKGN